MKYLWIALMSASMAACAGTGSATGPQDLRMAHYEEPLRVAAQGWIGLSELQSDQFEDGTDLPVIGGVYQQPLAGSEKASAGLEGGLSLEWKGDVRSFSTGGGGLVVTTDIDLLVTDLFFGPYGEFTLAERWRFYGAAGGLLEFVHGDADIDDPNAPGQIDVDDDAFGGGFYARTGLEYVLASGMSFGFGVRWVDSEVDFGDPLGEYDLQRVQWLFTLTSKM